MMVNSLKFWSVLFILVTVVYYIVHAGLLGEHKICEDMKLKEVPDNTFSLYFDKDHQLAHIIGPLNIGLLSEFTKMIQKNPETSGVIFNSKGGNIYQARGLAKLILQHSLNTYVFDFCYSACTIAYVAGTKRYLGEAGKLGFHQYKLDTNLMNPILDLNKEQAKDIAYFKTRIKDNDFIEQIFKSECTTIWMPDKNEMLKAGVVHEIIEN